MFDAVFPSLISVVALAGIGLLLGLLLSAAKLKLHVEKDPLIEKIIGLLPGANCGACGCAGCADYAAKIVTEGWSLDKCPGASDEAVAQIAALMNMEAVNMERQIAAVRCHGGKDVTATRFTYSGPQTCAAASSLLDGPKVCSYGCLGFGDCIKACMFDAIKMGEDGYPIVDKTKCTGCNMCVLECPRDVIALMPKNAEPSVMCMNKEKAPIMKRGCSVGCTGCTLCEKNCPEHAITVTSYCANIDYSKCNSCMKCVEMCPVPVISPIEKSKKYMKQHNIPIPEEQKETASEPASATNETAREGQPSAL